MTDLPPEDAVEQPDVQPEGQPDEQPDERELDDARVEELLADTPEEAAARAPGVVETGHPAVDEVVRSLEGLDAVPVDEHVALFEQAHEQLRRTLSGAGEES